jgi:predicted nucleotidyltransferase
MTIRPQTTQSALQEAVDRIASRFDPERIILFGSLARGQGGPDSDADLLIVMPVAGSRRQQAVQIDLALEGIAIPIDLVVVTPEDVDKDRDTIGSIIGEAVREGKVLYERAA